ncbi:DUF5906 domain-containing protein [Xanthobacter versatilis]|uniref:DUF5906 domain-containing protein n=1 Tax=Xanthobacter autotrophicus (strain ATCC BAA-1158 / Py2) TaxID=78245 RepID=UPI00372871EE
MSDYIANEEGRAEGIGAPAGALEKTVEFDIDTIEDAAVVASETPSKHDPEALNAHVAAGHDLIPLDGKKPARTGWRRMPVLMPNEAMARFSSGRNVGVRLTDTDLVIDVDPRHFAEGDDPLARLIADFGLPLSPFVLTGGGGRHLYMRKPADVSIVHGLPAYPGVEFATTGRFVVAAGSVHPNGKPYRLDDDALALSLTEAPEAVTALLEAIRRPSGAASSDVYGDVTPEQLEKLLSGLDVALYNRRHDDWMRIMMAAHYGTGGAGVDAFVAWSLGDATYVSDEEVIRRKWRSLAMKPNGVKLGTLLKALHDAGKGALVEEVLRAPAEEDFPVDDVEVPVSAAEIKLAAMNRGHFTVLHGGKYLVGRERHHPTLGHIEVEWFPDHAIRSHLDSRMVRSEDGKQKPLGSWWVRHPRRRQYDGVVFDPAPNRQHAKLYNLWRGWAVEPKAGDWSSMKRLVREVLCRGDEEAFGYVIRWAAFMVQQPHVPAEVALVFKGKKGVGKGTFGRALKLLAGMHGKQVAQAEHFVGRFNEHLMDCILLFVDEGYWAGDKKAEGALKNLITEPVLSFEPKGRPIVSGPNMLHVVIAANEDWIVPASADERRFAVFEADSDARKALPVDFFAALDAEMRNGGLAAMLHDLLAVDLGGWHPRSAVPNTAALVEQKVQAFRRDPLSFWWFRTLEAGAWDPKMGVDSPKAKAASWAEASMDVDSLGKEQMVADVGAVAKGMGRPGQFSKKAVATFLKSVGVEVDAKDKKGMRVWRVPVLADARHAFEVYVGGAIDWDAD